MYQSKSYKYLNKWISTLFTTSIVIFLITIISANVSAQLITQINVSGAVPHPFDKDQVGKWGSVFYNPTDQAVTVTRVEFMTDSSQQIFGKPSQGNGNSYPTSGWKRSRNKQFFYWNGNEVVSAHSATGFWINMDGNKKTDSNFNVVITATANGSDYIATGYTSSTLNGNLELASLAFDMDGTYPQYVVVANQSGVGVPTTRTFSIALEESGNKIGIPQGVTLTITIPNEFINITNVGGTGWGTASINGNTIEVNTTQTVKNSRITYSFNATSPTTTGLYMIRARMSGDSAVSGYNINATLDGGVMINGIFADLHTNSQDITISNSSVENQVTIINATINNSGYADANNVVVQFLNNGVEIDNSTINVSAFSTTIASVNWNGIIGPNNITIIIDPENQIIEYNKSNNNATGKVSISGYSTFYGSTVNKIVIGKGNSELYYFGEGNVSNVFVTDIDNNVDFSNLQAIGRKNDSTISANDFNEIDTALNMTNFDDSTTTMFSIDGTNPRYTTTFLIQNEIINNIPYINSTNSSTFITGLLWDMTDDASDNGEFDISDNEDLVIIANVAKSTQGKYGLYDYEIKIPALIRDQNLNENDFKIQRGYTEISLSATTATIVAGTDYDKPSSTSKAFIRIVDTRLTGAGASNTGATTQDPGEFMTSISNPQNLLTNITFQRGAAPTNYNTRIYWEIIEYLGASGGNNEIIIRDQTELSQTSGTTIDGNSTSVVNDNKVVVFITGQRHNAQTAGTTDRGLYTAEWQSTNSTPRFTRGDGTGNSKVSYAIVEFTGSNWNIQKVTHQQTATGPQTENIPTTLQNINKTFLHVQTRTTAGNLDEQGVNTWISSTNQLSFQRQSTASATQDVVAWIIENTQTNGAPMIVNHYNGTLSSGGPEPETGPVTINQIQQIDQASIMGETAISTGGGSATPRGSIGFTITNSTTATYWTSDSGQTYTYKFSVVQWPTIAKTSSLQVDFYLDIKQDFYR